MKRRSVLRVATAALFTLGLILFASAEGTESPSVGVATDPTYGPILVDSKGLTLYVYERDSNNTSNCYGGCARAWPPLIVTDVAAVAGESEVTGALGTTRRTDGTHQVTYNGMPLYYFVSDKKPGDTTGQDVGSSGRKWYVVPPAAETFVQAESISEQMADSHS